MNNSCIWPHRWYGTETEADKVFLLPEMISTAHLKLCPPTNSIYSLIITYCRQTSNTYSLRLCRWSAALISVKYAFGTCKIIRTQTINLRCRHSYNVLCIKLKYPRYQKGLKTYLHLLLQPHEIFAQSHSIFDLEVWNFTRNFLHYEGKELGTGREYSTMALHLYIKLVYIHEHSSFLQLQWDFSQLSTSTPELVLSVFAPNNDNVPMSEHLNSCVSDNMIGLP